MSAYRGVRIADFTQGVAGPMACMLLGDFEAEIVKVEPPGGDRLKDHPGYPAWNRNKRIVTLDLSVPADLAKAKDLARAADIAVFDHPPGDLEALGLDAASLRDGAPHLIHVWMPPYGTRGRWSRMPPRHSLLAATSGIAFRQGAYADSPIHLILPIGWYGQAVMAAGAMGAALYERGASGQGQAVTVSGLHGVSEVGGVVMVLDQPRLPRGAPQGASPSYRLYQCSDGEWFFLATLFMPFFRKAIDALGLGAHWEVLVLNPALALDVLEEVFRSQPRRHWLGLLADAGVPCAPVGNRNDWFAGEAVRHAGLRLEFDDPVRGRLAMPGPPARLSATPASVRSLPTAGPLPDWGAPQPRTIGPGASRPLEGVRVLDMGSVIAGALAGAVLANLGAEVIKIESPEGDPFRSDGGPFLTCNRGKRGLGIDLKQPGAKEMFFDLVRQSDVVLDNYRFGVRKRLGVDYEALRQINPRIISCSVNAYGDAGPRAPLPGFDPLLQAEGGMMAAQGGDAEPVLHTIAVNDVATAGVVAFGIISALNARRRTGEGQEVVTSLLAQSLTFQLGEVVTWEGRPPAPSGGIDCVGLNPVHRYYECQDGWLAVAAETVAEAEALLTVLGTQADPADALTAPPEGPLAGRLAATLAGRPRAATLDALEAAGVPCAPCVRGYEAYDDPWLAENDVFVAWRHPRLGEAVGVRSYADFDRTPGGFRHPVPDAGEHTRQVLAEFGLAPERIEALLAAGAVFEPAAARSHLRDGGAALFTQ
ncbi:CoA transferase [Phenylobacterium sp.]|uniref:CaiB/BaiF CoA-transferase family protein n=1 Tax=Phenylobacterium sp. TaxID=1871053 RepID=UPI0025E3C017|nr:CoA transferase [Phenylobacterium sp.]MCA3724167.1 CoA transferase [Phenylobacterium sp.]